MRHLSILALASLLCGCADSLLGPASTVTNASLFDQVWTETDQHYSFFDYKHVDWDSLRAVYRPQALAAPTGPALATVIGNMLDALHDVHVSLQAGTKTIRYLCRWDTVQTYYSASFTQTRYLSHSTTKAHLVYGYLSPTVGYLRVTDFLDDNWGDEVDGAVDALHAARTLVVDVRDNYGGRSGAAVAVAARFADATHVYGYIRLRNGPGHGDFTPPIAERVAPAGHHFDGAVYVLTNRKVFSSAEDFVLAMRTLPNVTIVGDTTAGASGGPLVRQLPNGWTFQISEWMEYTPQRTAFEGVGLAPDVVALPSASTMRAGTDFALERAVALSTPP